MRMIIALVCSVAAVAGLAAYDNARDNSRQSLVASGVSIAIPGGWTAESFTNDRGMQVFRTGNFPFQRADDDDVGQVARGAMERPGDILINLVDVTKTDPSDRYGGYPRATAPVRVTGTEAVAQEGYLVPAVIRAFSIEGRRFYMSVAFGSSPPSHAQLDEANAVLETLRVE